MQSSNILPTASGNRIVYLDILRGISIFFIFIANILYFSGSFFIPDDKEITYELPSLDKAIDTLGFIFVDGKFYSIFSLLFGIGFVIQYHKLKNSSQNFSTFFSKRMAGLLLIGLAHIYIFHGDILTLYALVGFMLIPFKNVTNQKLLIWSVVLLLLPVVHFSIIDATNSYYPYYFFGVFDSYWEAAGFPMETYPEWGSFPKFFYFFETNSWSEFFTISLWAPLRRVGGILMEGRIFKVLAMFVLGVWAGRKIMTDNLLNNTGFLKKVALLGAVIGLPINLLRTAIEYNYIEGDWTALVGTIAYAFGVAPLACGYAALIALWWKKENPKFLNWFAPVGRMALTNYVLQSIIATLLFFNVGFGLVGIFGTTYIFLIAVGVFIFQMLFSHWWLHTFKYGPLEWLWRKMTYGTLKHKTN